MTQSNYNYSNNDDYSYTIIHSVSDEDSLTLSILFSPECKFFDGHFNDFTLLPAVAQLFIAQTEAEKHWGNLGSFAELKQVKFRSPIFPNTTQQLTLSHTEKNNTNTGILTFSYSQCDNDGKKDLKSSGKILFRRNSEEIT